MATQRSTQAYTTALVGDPDSSALNALIGSLAASLEPPKTVVAGDYLDKKNLADRTKTFHIGCYQRDSLVDLINCPLMLRNIGSALNQADRVAWVIRPDDINANLKGAIAASPLFGVRSHVVVINTGGLSPELKDDPELLEVMISETRDLFTGLDIPIEFCLTVDAAIIDGESRGVDVLASYLIENRVDPRRPIGGAFDGALIGVEQSYAVSGPSGKPARVGYGPVRGRSVAVGETLTLLTVGGSSDQVRIAEIQEFGHSVTEGTLGASAAVLFHAAPKDRPKAGDLLTDKPEYFHCAEVISLDLSVQPGDVAAQTIGSLSGFDLCIGMACVSCKLVGFYPDDREPSRGKLSLRTSAAVPTFVGQPVLLGNGGNILGWGLTERI